MKASTHLHLTTRLQAGFKTACTCCLVALLFFSGTQLLAVNYTSVATGNWSTSSTWSPAGVPTIGDNVTIAAGHTITLTGVSDIGIGTLTITGTLELGGNNLSAGSLAGAGLITTASGTPTITTGSNGANTTFSGIIQDGGGVVALTKLGAGTFTYTGANTYTGVTTISAGAISIGSGAVTGAISNSSNITNNGTLIFNRSDNYTYSGVISGTGALTKSAGATLFLTGANTYTGVTNINWPGTLSIGNGGATGSLVSNMTNLSAVIFNRTGAYTYAGSISGGGSVTVSGSGTLTISGTLTYTGTTTVNAGATVQLGVNEAIPNTSALTLNGTLNLNGFSETVGSLGGSGTVTSTLAGIVNLTCGGTGATTTFSGVIQNGSGTVGITKEGAGILILTGTNTYTGVTILNEGQIYVGNFGPTGSILSDVTNNGTLQFLRNNVYTYGGVISGPGGVIKSGGSTLTFTGANTYTGVTLINSPSTLSIGNGGATGSIVSDITNGSAVIFNRTGAYAYPGSISGVGSVTVSGSGTLTVSGISTYTGTTTVNAGATVQLGVNEAMPNTTALTLNGTLNLNGFSETVGSLAGSGTVTSTLAGTANLTCGGTGAGTIFSGVIQNGSGTVSLTKNGAGPLYLTGSNTYTGLTTINEGVLFIGIGGADGSIVSDVVNNSSINFWLSSNLTYGGVISGPGQVTKSGSNTLTFTGAHTYTGVTLINSGTLSIGNGGATGSIVSDVTNYSALQFNRSAPFEYPGVISGYGILSVSGAGEITFTGINTYTGATTINAGAILSIGNGGPSGSITSNVTNNGSLIFNLSDAYDFAYIISGLGVVNQIGSGTLALSGSNTYTGSTTIGNGTLSVFADNNLGAAPASATPGHLMFSGTSTLNTLSTFTLNSNRGIVLASTTFSPDAGTTLSYAGIVDGSGSLTKTGAGSLSLSGVNTYSGNTTVSEGMLITGSASALGAAPLVTVGSTGVLRTDASLTIAGDLKVSATTAKVNCNGNNSSCNRLIFEGIEQPAGTHGSTASAATFKTNTYFTAGSTGVISNGDVPLSIEVLTVAAGQSASLPFAGSADATVYWGDGTFDPYETAGVKNHIYTAAGTYTISVYGILTGFGNGAGTYVNADKIKRVNNWGNTGLTDLGGAFANAVNLIDVPAGLPVAVTNLSYMFSGASGFNDADVLSWNTANVTDMQNMFANATSFDRNIGSWNIDNAADMTDMFLNVCLSNANYDGILNGWAAQPLRESGVPFHGGYSYHTAAAAAARTALLGTSWTITDGGLITDLYLTSAAGTDSQTVAIGTPIINITYNFPGTAGVNITGLPSGVSANLASGILTISGIPTVLGVYTYSANCGELTGTISVVDCIAGPATSTPTVCQFTALTPITHTTINATGIANDGVSGANGLPAGVSATWSADLITITGAPAVSGVFNYSIPLTSCAGVFATGTITVTAATTYYSDADGDTFGDALATATSCTGAPVGFVTNNTDCNDSDAAIKPGATEICNAIDDDCDGTADDGLIFLNYYTDADGDGFGSSAATAVNSCSPVMGSVTNNTDCNDSDAAIKPGATEICNAIDDDCDGTADDGFTFITYFADADADTYGDPDVFSITCDGAPAGYVTDDTDCNDGDDAINPGATEICNAIDDDCDGTADDGLTFIYYADADGDTYGDPLVFTTSCDGPPAGYLTDNSDCNDADDAINPDATEICNAIDDNCDGTPDDGLTFLNYYTDEDGDGFGSSAATAVSSCSPIAGSVTNNDDCNDLNAAIKPGGTEICNAVDDDCDGSIDDGVLITFYIDADGDTYGNAAISVIGCTAPAGYVANDDDCDDTQVLYADIDVDGFGSGSPAGCGVTNNLDCFPLDITYTDADGDGYGINEVVPCGVLTSDDCDDTQVLYADIDGDGFGSGTPEACGINNNLDCFELDITYGDADGDGYGSDEVVPCGVLTSDDCDDALLLYADIDGDGFGSGTPIACGIADNSDCLPLYITYTDADGDGFGTEPYAPCGPVNSDDCDDDNDAIYPDAPEVCDGLDNDCNGLTDDALVFIDYYADADGDTYGNAAITSTTCDGAPVGYVTNSTDCDDTQNTVYPGATEVCDGLDNDCDGEYDEGIVTATVTPGGTVTTCRGIPYVLVANEGGGLTYQWFKNGNVIAGATNMTYGASKPGNYQVQVNSPLGCFGLSFPTTVQVNPNPNANIFAPNGTSLCATVKLKASYDATYTWQWRNGGVAIPGATNFQYFPALAGSYNCTITNAFGCSRNTASIVVTACKEGEVATAAALETFELYPNPTEGEFTLDMELNTESAVADVVLFNMVGAQVYAGTVAVDQGVIYTTITLDDSIPSGIYLVKVRVSDKTYSKQIMIQK